MLAKTVLHPILHNDALTRGLGDRESKLMIEWLVGQAERRAKGRGGEDVHDLVARLVRRARGIGRFIELWCYQGARGPATQLAAAEGFRWSLPAGRVDPCDLMIRILNWEARHPTPAGD